MCLNNQIQPFFFLGCSLVPFTKLGDIEINLGSNLPFALMMKDIKLIDSRIKILHQKARRLAGQNLLFKELNQDIGYICIYSFSETWLSQNLPEELWNVEKQNFDCY